MDPFALLNRMEHFELSGSPKDLFLRHEDAELILQQVIEEYEHKEDSKLKSSRQILGYIDGLLGSKTDASEDDPVVKVLSEIRFYITTTIG